jgi:hypothetical protein
MHTSFMDGSPFHPNIRSYIRVLVSLLGLGTRRVRKIGRAVRGQRNSRQ